jgi:hypothetical protein
MKLDSKSIPCIIRATLEHGNYHVYDMATKKVYVSRILRNLVSRVHPDQEEQS